MKDTRKLSTLHGWKDNPRNITPKDYERLKLQIQKLGQYKPILITKDGEVIGGNMRLKAYQELGITDVWVSEVDPKDENQKLEYALSDNDRAGYYDDDLLANLIPNYDIDWSQYAVDMKPPEDIQALIDRIAPVEEDEAPEVSEGEAISKLGEVYQLGRHRLMCGDSTKIEDVEKLMDGQKADMVFTSPPYNANTKSGDGDIFTSKKSKKLYADGYSDNLPADEYVSFAQSVLGLCFKFTDGFIFWNVSYNKNSRYQYIQQITPWLEYLREQICWKKSSTIPFKGSMMRDWEPIYLFSTIKANLGLDKVTSNFWEVSNTNSQQENHKACYPVELVVKGIELINGSMVVFDPFLGSGSTLIASEKTDRICYGMELDPKYCDVIRKRYAKFIGKEDSWEITTPSISL